MKRLALLMLTYDRKEYTQMVLEQLWENTPSELYDLTIVDNYTTRDDTRKYLVEVCKGRPGVKLVLNKENQGLTKPTNQFWKDNKDKYGFLGKVDNDTLVPKGWLEKLLEAMDKVPELMMVSAVHFSPPPSPSMEKNGVKLHTPSHTGGCCYILRPSTIYTVGYIPDKGEKGIFGWTFFQEDMRAKKLMLAYRVDLRVVVMRSLGKTNPKYAEYNKEIHKLRH